MPEYFLSVCNPMFVSEIVGLLLSLAVSQTVTVGMVTRISVHMYALKYVKSSK